MFTLRGRRDFVHSVDREAVLQALAIELPKLGASSVDIDGDRVVATGLRVREPRTPTIVLNEFTLVLYGGSSPGIRYETKAEIEYSPGYYMVWLLPCTLVIAYAFLVSPLIPLLLPLGAILIRALLPINTRMWLEGWLHSIELRAQLAATAGA